jgi:hypothetical protein
MLLEMCNPRPPLDSESTLLRAMAPYLAQSQRDQLHDMITSTTLGGAAIANTVGCGERTVTRVRANIRIFGDLCHNSGVSRAALRPSSRFYSIT